MSDELMKRKGGIRMLKKILFTHTDLDGAGCAILFRLANTELLEDEDFIVVHCPNATVDKMVIDTFKRIDIDEDTEIFFTDIVASVLTMHDVSERCKKIHIYDHHQTNMHVTIMHELNQDFVNIVPVIDGIPKSGTSLFYERYIVNKINSNELIKSFVYAVEEYDTFRFKQTGNMNSKYLNILMYMIGIDRFEKKYTNYLSNNETGALIDDASIDFILAKIEAEQKFIDALTPDSFTYCTINGRRCGLIINPAANVGELAIQYLNKHPELDVIIGVIITNHISLEIRCISEEINTGIEIALPLGGGGHPKASGATLTDKCFNDIITAIETELKSVNWNTCTTVGKGAFPDSKSLTTVSLPVCESVGNEAFYSCESLVSVDLPVCESVGDGAFYDCESLSTVSLPVCESVGNEAFSSCTSLQSVSLPVCTEIGDDAFQGCTSLVSVDLPVCESVGDGAFYDCESLSTVSLPVCTNIGYKAFTYCRSLQSIDLPACVSVNKNAFQGCTSLQSVDMSVCKSISNDVFYNCKSLQSIDLPACICVGSYAFNGCKSLQSVNLPVCTSIGYLAFADCPSLESVNLPACASIDAIAFYYCRSLTTVDLPVCTSIGANAFKDCRALASIYIGASRTFDIDSNVFDGTGITPTTGFIFVRNELVDAFKSTKGWSYFSDRIFGYDPE